MQLMYTYLLGHDRRSKRCLPRGPEVRLRSLIGPALLAAACCLFTNGCFSSTAGSRLDEGSIFLIFDRSLEGRGGSLVIVSQVEGNTPESETYTTLPELGIQHDLFGEVLSGGTEVSVALSVYPITDTAVTATVDGNVVIRVSWGNPDGFAGRFLLERVL
jgi:hypothetical protein